MQTQYFLPMVTQDRRIIGMVSHAATTYVGNETTVTLGGIDYPVRRVTFNSPSTLNQVMDFMAIDVSPTQERTIYKNLAGATRAGAMSLWYWAGTQMQKFEAMGDFEWFMRGLIKDVSPIPPTPPAPGLSAMSRTWYANSPFGNAPSCSFIDLNWNQLTGMDSTSTIASVSLGNPSADPGNGLALKAMLVYPSNVVNVAARDSNVRILRITKGPIPVGNYIWPLSVTDTSGQTTSVNVTIAVA